MNIETNRHSFINVFVKRTLFYTFIQSFVSLAILLAAIPSLTSSVTYISDNSSALEDDVVANDVVFQSVTLSDDSAGRLDYTVDALL